ncbi:MAG: DUF6166 domain-containing protein [Gemmataceae bacterium]
MKLYEGVRTSEGCRVTVDDRPLALRHDLRNHSPDGPEWGYSGSGPAQLALALLADATGDDELAQAQYQRFKREVVAVFERDRFLITQAEIRCWIASVLTPPEQTS